MATKEMVGSQELGGICSLSIQLITVLHRIMFPTGEWAEVFHNFGFAQGLPGVIFVPCLRYVGEWESNSMHGWGRRLGGIFGVSEDGDSLHKVAVFYGFLGKPWNHNMVLNFLRIISHPVFSLFFGDLVFRHFQTKANSWLILGQVRLAGWQGLWGPLSPRHEGNICSTQKVFCLDSSLDCLDTPNLWRSVADYGRFFLRLCQSATRRNAYSDNRRKKLWYSNNRNHFCKELQQFWPCQSLMRQDGFGRFRWPSGQSFEARRMEFDAGGEAIGYSCHSCRNTLSWCQCWIMLEGFRIAASHCPQKVPSCAIQNPCHF